MKIRRFLNLALVVWLSVFLYAEASAGEDVITESRQVLIPAGPGRKPFDATRHTIPLPAIKFNIPRDTIPALSRPLTISVDQANAVLKDADRVVGVFLGGEARAYPVGILNWHELVNDDVGGVPVLISWCPLCGSAVVFDPVVDGQRLTFGVSGLLYKRNVLMFDRMTDSLWSQLLARAVTGPYAGKELEVFPAAHTTWGEWKALHPATRVMSFTTGYARDYRSDPYKDFPLSRNPAVLVMVGDDGMVFPYSQLAKARGPVRVDLGDSELVVEFDRKSGTPHVTSDGTATPVTFFGFVQNLKNFYPRADVWKFKR